ATGAGDSSSGRTSACTTETGGSSACAVLGNLRVTVQVPEGDEPARVTVTQDPTAGRTHSGPTAETHGAGAGAVPRSGCRSGPPAGTSVRGAPTERPTTRPADGRVPGRSRSPPGRARPRSQPPSDPHPRLERGTRRGPSGVSPLT